MSLDKSIFETVAFFDIFDYPLTSFEIWQYLPEQASLLEVREALQLEKSHIKNQDGFFFLSGREEILSYRRGRYTATDRKIKKAKRRLRMIQWLPGVRLICLANSIGSHNFRPDGDTDLFIITKTGRLWFVKLAATLITMILGWRPTAKKSADQICLSFLIDESSLGLSGLAQTDDKYFPYWLAGLVPLYGDPQVYKNLIAANQWLQERLPNWSSACAAPRKRFTSSLRSKDILVGSWVEIISRKIQERVMSSAIKALANKDQRVIVTDHMLKLHTVDRREKFKEEFNTRIKRYA